MDNETKQQTVSNPIEHVVMCKCPSGLPNKKCIKTLNSPLLKKEQEKKACHFWG